MPAGADVGWAASSYGLAGLGGSAHLLGLGNGGKQALVALGDLVLAMLSRILVVLDYLQY